MKRNEYSKPSGANHSHLANPLHILVQNNFFVDNSEQSSSHVSKKDDCILSVAQENYIFCLILKNVPEKFGLKQSVWTQELVRKLIYLKFNINFPLDIVVKYLTKWGIFNHNTLRVTYEKYPKAIKKWLLEEYSEIIKRARNENINIYWINQKKIKTFLKCEELLGYCEKNAFHEKREEELTVISSLYSSKEVRFMLCNDGGGEHLINFIDSLIFSNARRFFVILDKMHDYNVQTWIDSKRNHFEVFYLPNLHHSEAIFNIEGGVCSPIF